MSTQSLERRYVLKAGGVDIDFAAKRVLALLGIPEEDTRRESNGACAGSKPVALTGSLSLEINMAAMARRLNISPLPSAIKIKKL